MPTAVTPTLATLRNLIKIEARVSGANDLDTFIDALVNELLANYAQKGRYFEFLLTNQPVTTTLNNGTYALPDDFIAMRLIRYQQEVTQYVYTLNPRPQFIDTARGLRPKWYDLVGATIEIFPSDDVPAGDTLLLDYWSFPQTLTSNSVFPVPKLLTPVKLEAVRRTLIYNNQLQAAQILKGDAAENEVRSRKP